MSSGSGPGRAGVDKRSAIDPKDRKAERTGGDDNARAGRKEKERPACLPLPSPPRLPSKRTLTDSSISSAVARFEEKCTVGGVTAISKRTSASGGEEVVSGGAAVRTPAWDKGSNAVDLEARERTAQAWIEAVSGRPCVAYGTKQFARNLMSGEILCALVNAIRPGTILHVHESQLGFEQMENIDNFLSACCKLGVPAHALVDTVDVFEMRDTPKVVECVHALGSAVQVSCPAFDGPHLGPTADPSLVAAIPSAVNDDDDAIKPSGIGNGSNDIDDEDNDDDEDGAFGDFWRASARTRGGAGAGAGGGQHDGAGSGGESLALNMQDVERPRSTRRGFTTTVGSITDLDPPATLSARARDMCPKEGASRSPYGDATATMKRPPTETSKDASGTRVRYNRQMVNSPRALVFNADPVGHPTRSPSLRAAWESSAGGAAAAAAGRSAWGTDTYPAKRIPVTSTNLWATTPLASRRSPAGLWAPEPETDGGGGGGGSVSPSSASGGPTTITADAEEIPDRSGATSDVASDTSEGGKKANVPHSSP